MSDSCRSRRIAIVLAALMMLTSAGETSAQVFYDWINPSGGSFHTAANWFPGAGAPPGPDDGAGFGLAATYTVNFFSSVTVSDVDVSNGDVTFDSSATLTALAVKVSGFGSVPRLTLQSGTVFTDTLLISNGGQLFESGTFADVQADDITVTGAGSALNKVRALNLPHTFGPGGSGTLNISGGGHVSDGGSWLGHNDSDGTATVTGTGSTWTNNGDLLVGIHSGTGTLMIQQGGQVSNAVGRIGSESGNGSVTVTGSGSTWTSSGGISVGRTGGTGMLSVQNGGAVSTPGDLLVGNGATGTMNLMAEATVTSGDGFIGTVLSGVNGTGTVTVGGANAVWNILGRLSLGGNADSGVAGGPSTLNIDPDGTVLVAQDVVLFPDGLIRLKGGNLAALDVRFQGGGQFDWTSGTLQLDTFHGDLVNQGGTLLPGSANLTEIIGTYSQQSAGEMAFVIGGTTPIDDFNQVAVDEMASLDGTLNVSLLGGFTPSADDMFEIITAPGGIIGSFAMEVLPTLAGALDWNVVYNPNSVVLEVVAGLAGDYNRDGSVDAADYVVWRKNPANFGGDPAGYDAWRANFGRQVGAGSGFAASPRGVPEPRCSVLVCLALAWRLASGRRIPAAQLVP
jgi:T5SS/PEP-CTERM-associated repeat protein